MAVWTTPITWVNGAVTASSMNTEIRDHLNWLKNGLDVLTNGSANDTGTSTYIRITRPVVGDDALGVRISGDGDDRTRIQAGGAIRMGDGSAAPSIVASFSGGVLNFDRMIYANSLVKLYTKSGVLNDTDIPGYFSGSATGCMGIDVTNSRIYVRIGSNWKFVNLV